MTTTARTSTPIPALEEMKSKRQWVCWCFEKDSRGRLTKIPYNARSGYKASSTNSKSWSSYDEACKALQNCRNVDGKPYDGIGFVFNEDCTGIDFDHCIDEDGAVDNWAQDRINTLNSYSEKSPSGTGVHIIARGLIPKTQNAKGEMVRQGKKVRIPGQRDPGAAIEMYSVGRFFTVTGNHLSDTPDIIEDRQEQIETLYAHLSKQPETQKTPSVEKNEPATPLDLSDEELLKKAESASNGSTFTALWNGNLTGYNNDHSSADQALCNLLAFWTGKDAARMDRLFRRSQLYRKDKWDRNARSGETYGQGTINRAIASCSEVYTGSHLALVPHQSATKNSGENERPAFIIEGQMKDQVRNALEILQKTNQKNPQTFIYLSMISEIAFDEMNNPIIMHVERAALRNTLNNAADFFKWKLQKGNEPPVLVDAHPPKDLADQILALPPNKWPFPPLKAIVEAPVLRPDGSILDRPGFDEKTHLYYVPSPGMERCKIPMNPTRADIEKSVALMQEMFADFPWEGKADLANAIGLLFTPFVRYAVKEDIQMALIDANNAGTGKGLITIVVSIVATGKVTTPITAKRDDEEWRKSILTELLQSPRIVIIDNIRGVLESTALESMLTGGGVNDRILGQSKNAKPKNEATWMATGNNLLIGGDLPRRCYRIRLISPTAAPEEREDIKIDDLKQWAIDHRVELVTAVLTIARAWYVAGKPKPKNVPKLGTFTDWAKTIGGMLEFAGIEGFQSNRDELRSRNNEEAQEWEAFLTAWYNTYGSVKKTASEIADDIRKAFLMEPPAGADEPPANMLLKTLPQYLKSSLAEKPKSFHVALPIQLGKRVQTVYGLDSYRIEKDEDPHTKIKLWKVTRGVAVGYSSHAGKNNFQGSMTSTDAHTQNTTGSATNHPQPPANSKKTNNDIQDGVPSDSFTGSSIENLSRISGQEVAGGYREVAGGYESLETIDVGPEQDNPKFGYCTKHPDREAVDKDKAGMFCGECLDRRIAMQTECYALGKNLNYRSIRFTRTTIEGEDQWHQMVMDAGEVLLQDLIEKAKQELEMQQKAG